MRKLDVVVLVVLAVCVYALRSEPRQGSHFAATYGRGLSDSQNRNWPPPDAYLTFVNNVMMIRDPDVLKSLDDVIGFPALAKEAGAGSEISEPDIMRTLVEPERNRLLQGWPAKDNRMELSKAGFRPLAIAFRPDLANYQCGKPEEGPNACGAEVHVDFGLFETDTSMTIPLQLIAEFSTGSQSKTDFQRMVNDWSDLARTGADSAKLAARFRDNWKKWRIAFSNSRIRMSSKISSDWSTHQFTFENHILTAASRLPGEINRTAWLTKSKPFLLKYNNDSNSVDQVPEFGIGNPSLNAALDFSPPCNAGEPLHGAAWTKCPSPKDWNEIRFNLSINTCSGCHSSAETGSPNVQIENVGLGIKGKLSVFLTGDQNHSGDPLPPGSFYEIADPSKLNPQPTMRRMNDLARRYAYTDAVRTVLKPGDKNWTAKLNELNLRILAPH